MPTLYKHYEEFIKRYAETFGFSIKEICKKRVSDTAISNMKIDLLLHLMLNKENNGSTKYVKPEAKTSITLYVNTENKEFSELFINGVGVFKGTLNEAEILERRIVQALSGETKYPYSNYSGLKENT